MRSKKKGIKYQLKKWQRRIKGVKTAKKVFGILITVINLGITLWQIYENQIKDRLEARSASSE